MVRAPWGDWVAGVIALLILGQMLVGVGEELVFRGFLLVGARPATPSSVPSCSPAFCSRSAHGANVLTGRALGPTFRQMLFAAVLGAAFYLLRRASGLLAIAMLVRGLINVVAIVQVPPS